MARIGDAMMIKFLLLFLLWPTLVFASPPVMFFSDLTSGPNTGGQDNKGVFVTVWGRNFGASQGASTVSVGGGLVDNYPEWSDTKVCFQLGANAATGDIILTTTEGTTNTLPFTVRAGNIYFITPTGTGNGDYATPMSPSDYVTATQSEDGATGYFRAGTYDGEYGHAGWQVIIMLELTNAGVSGAPNAFVGYPGEVALFKTKPEGTTPDSSGFKYAANDTQNPTDYIVVAKLSFDTRLGAIEADSNWRVVGNDIESGDSAMASGQITMGRYWPATDSNYYTSNNIKILGNSLHGGRSHTHLDHCIYPASGTNNLEIGWNHMYDNDWDNGVLISINMNEAYAKKLTSTGIYIHDNLMDTTIYPSRKIGTFELAPGSEIYYYNNVMVGTNGGATGSVYGVSGNLYYYNNTSYDTGGPNMGSGYDFYCVNIYDHNYCPESVTMFNNIIYTDSNTQYYIRNTATGLIIDQDYNQWYGIGDFASHSDSVTLGSHSVDNQDPQFVSTSDFHLQATSPARNAGTTVALVTKDYDGISRPQETNYAIGAYEYALSVGPTRTTIAPIGEQPAGTTQVTFSVDTNGSSDTCTYGDNGATGGMYPLTNPMVDSGTHHTATISGLVNGGSYSNDVKCTDGSTANGTDHIVSWSVAAGTQTTQITGSVPPVH